MAHLHLGTTHTRSSALEAALRALNAPAVPPAYEPPLFGSAPMEQFDIDEDEVYQPIKRGSLLERARFVSRRLFFRFREHVSEPVSRALDPLHEGYNYFRSHYELSILRLGNPLVVKRILYVLFVVVLFSVMLLKENSDGVNGASGGAFSSGKFYDVEKLSSTLVLYLSANTLKDNVEYLSSMPHLAGSTGDLALARYVESYYTNNGIQVVDFHELDSFLNYPKLSGTYLRLADGSFLATLNEGGDDLHLLAFSPNSPSSGEITAPYIYVNYADPADIEKIYDAGIDVKDAILLVRYGGSTPTPNKVAAAHKLGARAVVFISPSIKWAGETHDDVIQKVNVGLTRYSPGDVLTPGWSFHDNYASRLDWAKSPCTAKIPTIPISWKDGKQLIQKLGKNGVDFGDGLFSGSKSDVQLKFSVQHDERSTHLIWNVIGSIPGREQAQKGIIFGAPRDSTCFGASTSASGTAALLELVKVFTSLQRRFDWSPARSIYFASFDASQYNLAGSAEWAEERREQLVAEGYTYIDLTALVHGDDFTVKANPLLHDVILEEMKKVSSDGGKSLYDKFVSESAISNNMLNDRDYMPFINFLNIPSMSVSYEGKTVPQHSCLDTFSNFEKELDRNMNKHIEVLNLVARVGLRLAEDPLIPFNFNTLTDKIADYAKDLEKYVTDKANSLGSDVHPNIHFEHLQEGINQLREGSQSLELFKKNWRSYFAETTSLEPAMLAQTRRLANDNMVLFNKEFLATGERTRAGYHNFLFGVPYDAPSHDDETYEWNTFPMVRDCAASGDFGRARHELERVGGLLTSASDILPM